MQSDIDASNKPEPEAPSETSLALKKLALEIAELERPWWKRPNYILAALPTLLAIVALLAAWVNGFFGAQLTKLENQRHDLESQIKEFEGTRKSLVSQNQELQQEIWEKNGILNEIHDTASRLNTVLVNLAIHDSPQARTYTVGHDAVAPETVTPEQRRKADAKAREEAKSELSEVVIKLREILAKAGVKEKPATADISISSEPATVVPRQPRKKR